MEADVTLHIDGDEPLTRDSGHHRAGVTPKGDQQWAFPGSKDR